jgi:hypothetical protein
MRLKSRLLAAAIGAAATLGVASPAAAYCRSNTCDPRQETCLKDDEGCIYSGRPLSWQSSCVTFAVQEDGSLRNEVSLQRFEQEVFEAFERWLTADCGGGESPLLEVQNIGPVSCNKVEYNQRDGNANIFMFRDAEWPYTGGEDALGLSTIRFDPDSGHIYDVDIEINGTDTPITVGDPVQGADLASILTHEVGHFLGLSHSRWPGATMRPGYSPGDDSLRTLSPDDVDGICDALSPDREPYTNSCTPRHGFSEKCGEKEKAGCSTQTPHGSQSGGALVIAGLAAAFALGRARRRSSKMSSRSRTTTAS